MKANAILTHTHTHTHRNIGLYNCCNMQHMKNIPNFYYDLADDDPPYFSGPEKRQFYGHEINKLKIKRKDYPITDTWDLPTKDYFDEVRRVSKNQIIWGANYFDFIGTPFKTPRGNLIFDWIKENPIGWIVWDKCNGESSFNDYELAWTSFNRPTVIYKYMWNGMLQGKSMLEGHIMQGDKSKNQKRIHPTEKPIILYDWVHSNYTKPGDKVLSNFMGSGSDALSALKFNIEFTAIEKSKIHFDNAVNRIIHSEKQQKLILF